MTTILETVASDPHGVTLGVLAGVLDAPKSSVHSLVAGLLATGYLREQDGVYMLGPAVAALLAPPRPSVAEAARPELERLHREFDETVMLATLVGGSVVYLDAIESTQLIRYSAPLRRRRVLYPTSSGKTFLAHMPEARREAYLREQIPDERRRAEVREELDAVRRTGVAYNRGETVPDTTGVAAAVLAGRRLVACVVMAGPTPRMAGRLDAAAGAVRGAAHEIGRGLG